MLSKLSFPFLLVLISFNTCNSIPQPQPQRGPLAGILQNIGNGNGGGGGGPLSGIIQGLANNPTVVQNIADALNNGASGNGTGGNMTGKTIDALLLD
jgi:hypothetical protein